MTAAAVAAESATGGTPGSGGPLLLGVRHHGPGSARGVRAALDATRPRVVLIEGPPEGDALVGLAADPAMRPPVALLAHAVDDPGRAAFWPFAAFSPEWAALRWALGHGVPVRFIDLPASQALAFPDEDDPDREDGCPGGEGERDHRSGLRADPLAVLARTAGHDDPERWWEDAVEHRGGGADPLAPFAAVAEAMTALREGSGEGGEDRRDLVREAHMRSGLRAARREFGTGTEVAVVCGAWHVPALLQRTTATADRALLKGLPKVRAELTWVPWTHRRLARRSGYGAGIESPGWYAHLFEAPDRPVERWMTRVARLLRTEDRTVSSAHVIEAVRLAAALAALRGRPLAGLTETLDAVRAVLLEGSDAPLALVMDRLVVGDTLGEVPDGAPAVPLQRDLTRLQRALRLRPEAAVRELDLDLRGATDTARSALLHRLRLLGVAWGRPCEGRASTGTFRESWRLRWEPELSVRVAEAGIWGTTVLDAATARARDTAVSAASLADITGLAERCLLADLPDALPVVLRVLADRAALDSDVGHLAQALPALARSLRYGDVRGTGTAALGEVARALAERICVGLPPACTGLDADGAEAMRIHLDAVHGALALLPAADGDLPARWEGALRKLAARDSVAGCLRGRATRILLDGGRLDADEAAVLMGLALSPGTPPADAAGWIDGFVGAASGGGLLLVHDESLLGLVDAWLTTVTPRAFADVLPLLRRTFSAYDPAIRRAVGELVRRGPAGAGRVPAGPGAPGFGDGTDEGRAAGVGPLVELLLGRARGPGAGGDSAGGAAGAPAAPPAGGDPAGPAAPPAADTAEHRAPEDTP